MNIAQALDFINSQLMANTLKTLSTIETTILKEAWKGKDSQTYKQIGQNTNYNGDSIKQAAYGLWKRLKQLCGETVNRDNVQAVVERYYNKVSIASPPVPTPVPTPPAPTYTDFVGREKAISDLNTHINQGAKIIVIQAPGGVGKTTLAQQYLKSQGFEFVLDLQMAKETENITPVENVMEEWLKRDFGEEPGREFGVMLGRLKRQLQTHKVGVLIDNLEPALDGHGRFIEPHRRYVELLRVLADYSVQSVTFITSREPLAECMGVINYRLPSLNEQAWQDFFRLRDIDINEITLNEMHKAYGGNALAMNILCDPIQRDGGMVAYWQEHKVEADLLVELAVKNLIEEQFNRLKETYPEAYQLLYRLGCYRYQDVLTVSTEGLLCLLWDVPEAQRRRVIKSLRSRSLVEWYKKEYWLNSVIREEAIARLRYSEEWKEANRKAAEFWRNSVRTVETVEDGRRAFEAYYHYVEINDFEQAGYVIVSRRDISWRDGESLGAAFYRLGLLQPMLYSINSIINKVKNERILSGLYSSLGDLYRLTGDINAAIECHHLSFKAAERTLLSRDLSPSIYFDAKRLKTWSLFNTGLCRIDLWELEEAVIVFQEIEFICNNHNELEHGLYNNEKDYLYCLAFLNSFLGFKESALNYVKQAEVVIYQIDYCCWSQGYSLLFMGLTYKNLGEIEKSFEIFHQAIAFAEKSHYTQVKAKALSGMAELYREQGEFATARTHNSESIELLEKIGAKCDLAEAYYQGALTYQKMGNTVDSEEYFNQAITLYEEMKAPKQIARVRQSILMMS